MDEESFMTEKQRHFQATAREWAKGYQHPLQHMRSLKADCVETGTLFEKQKCPRNLMDPSFPRTLSIAKVYQLKNVAAQRVKAEKRAKRGTVTKEKSYKPSRKVTA